MGKGIEAREWRGGRGEAREWRGGRGESKRRSLGICYSQTLTLPPSHLAPKVPCIEGDSR